MDFLHAQIVAIQNRLSFVQDDPTIDWRSCVLKLSWGICLFEIFLLMRQYPLYSKTAPPAILAEHFTPEVFEKSQKYGKHKAKFSIFSGLYTQFIDTLQLASGMYHPWAWMTSGRLIGLAGFGPEYQISQSVVFVLLLTFFSTLPTLPVGLYQTFVLEEQHVLGAPLLSAFLYVFEWAGDRFVPWLMMLLLVFQLSMVILYPTIIQPLFNKLSPLPEGELRTRVEALASKLKFPLKHLYEIDGSKRSSHSNAYFFGLPWSKHIVIFDTLVKQSKPEEVEAVLAHELGHWYYLTHETSSRDPTAPLYHPRPLPGVPQRAPFLRSFGFPESVASRPPPIIAFSFIRYAIFCSLEYKLILGMAFQMLLTPLESVIGMALHAISRRFEYQADRFACDLPAILHVESAAEKEAMKDMGTRLGRALVRLHVDNLSTVWVDWLYSAYHHSHPTLTERLKALGEYGSEGLGKTDVKQE
ncbi:peptidase family M48-domain-containing protein [Lactifluus volemus]|nr:peptidase family M48-domain-containing protein [Lactifluus volemus]